MAHPASGARFPTAYEAQFDAVRLKGRCLDEADQAIMAIYRLALEFIAQPTTQDALGPNAEEMARAALSDGVLCWGLVWRARYQEATRDGVTVKLCPPRSRDTSAVSPQADAARAPVSPIRDLRESRRGLRAGLHAMRDALITVGRGHSQDPGRVARAGLHAADEHWNELARARYQRALAAL